MIVWAIFLPLNLDDKDVIIKPMIHDSIMGIIGNMIKAIIEDK